MLSEIFGAIFLSSFSAFLFLRNQNSIWFLQFGISTASSFSEAGDASSLATFALQHFIALWRFPRLKCLRVPTFPIWKNENKKRKPRNAKTKLFLFSLKRMTDICIPSSWKCEEGSPDKGWEVRESEANFFPEIFLSSRLISTFFRLAWRVIKVWIHSGIPTHTQRKNR